MNDQPPRHRCAGTKISDVGFTVPHAAALVGAERPDGLAGEVEPLQKGEYRHGHGAPVIGVAQIDGVIFVQTVRVLFQFWPGIPALVVLGFGDALVIVRGIGLDGVDLEPVCPGQCSPPSPFAELR